MSLKRATVFPEEAGIGNNPREAESEDVRRIKSEPEDGNCDDPGVENAISVLKMLSEIKEEVVEIPTTSSSPTHENVTPGLKMLPEIKQEVVKAATTASSPTNGADILPGNDCDSDSDSQSVLEKGDIRSVISDSLRYKCGLCDYSGKSTSNLKLHMKSHTGSRPFHCDLCPAAFQQRSDLVAHRRTHPKEVRKEADGSRRPNYCILCREQFTSRQVFQQHKAAHTKEKRHGCTFCSLRFDCTAAMGRHIIAKHTHDYRCDRCGKGFVSSAWHKKHQASCFAIVMATASDESPEQQS